jgi:DNA-binding transcriptional regulator YiaG
MHPEINSNDSTQDAARLRVRRVRRACHLAQGPIASGANLDTSTLCRWETGKIRLSPKQIQSIQASLLAEIAGRLRVIKEEVVAVSV